MKSNHIPYGHQTISSKEIHAVAKTLKSDWLTQGPLVKKLEEKLSKYCGSKYAVVVSSGTAALHLACLALNIGKGDELITSANTFVASANCGVYCGAYPRLIDIELKTYNLDIKKLELYLGARRQNNKKKRVVVPVHFAGHPIDMDKIKILAKKHRLSVIEDASHAFGTTYKYNGKSIRIGSSLHSNMTVFSFHPVKTITTGEGGAILTNKKELYERLLRLRSHGITKSKEYFKKKSEGAWYYEMHDLGYNYRMTDFQCSLGIEQLKKTDSFIKRRNRIASLYTKSLSKYKSLILPQVQPDCKSSFHLYVIRIKCNDPTLYRKKIYDYLRKNNIGVQIHYIPINYHPFYQKNYGYKEGDFPNAEKYYNSALSLPIFPTLTDSQVYRVVRILGSALKNFGLN